MSIWLNGQLIKHDPILPKVASRGKLTLGRSDKSEDGKDALASLLPAKVQEFGRSQSVELHTPIPTALGPTVESLIAENLALAGQVVSKKPVKSNAEPTVESLIAENLALAGQVVSKKPVRSNAELTVESLVADALALAGHHKQ